MGAGEKKIQGCTTGARHGYGKAHEWVASLAPKNIAVRPLHTHGSTGSSKLPLAGARGYCIHQAAPSFLSSEGSVRPTSVDSSGQFVAEIVLSKQSLEVYSIKYWTCCWASIDAHREKANDEIRRIVHYVSDQFPVVLPGCGRTRVSRRRSRGGEESGAAMTMYRGQSRFVLGSDLPIGVNDNIDQVQEERCATTPSTVCQYRFLPRLTSTTRVPYGMIPVFPGHYNAKLEE